MKTTHTPGPWTAGGREITARGQTPGTWRYVAAVRIGSKENWGDPESEGWSGLRLDGAREAIARAGGRG